MDAIESYLLALGEALRARDSAAIEAHAGQLHRALSDAVPRFSRAASGGDLPPVLRERLVRAGGAVAAQRESLARATAALDRAIDVLLPPGGAPLYAANGSQTRPASSGMLSA